MSEPAIRVEGLSRRFGGLRAVNNLSFQVAPGRVCGFLGRNGSGKTTTIRMLLAFNPAETWASLRRCSNPS